MGLRLERTQSDISRTKAASNSFGFPSPQDAPIVLDSEKNLGSVNLGVVHALSESLSLRARSSIAHKPAGHTAFTGSPTLASFDSERSWASEAGVTFGPPKGTFGGSILGFWSQIDNYQFERTVVNSTDFIVVNAREVISRGVEAKFMWNPVPSLWWDFQAGYTDAKFENHRDASGASVSGKRVPFIPRSTLRTGVTVDLGGGFSANASYVAAGRTYYDERNTGAFSQKGYGTINAQLRYRFQRWTTTIYGQNLADKNYYQFVNPEIFAGSPGAPRRVGVQLAFSY
jgi:outer membrane receptor protein involved in Fe transport